MRTLRRGYLYLLASVSLLVLLAGLLLLPARLDELAASGVPLQAMPISLATGPGRLWVGVALIAFAAWILHHFLANGLAARSAENGGKERDSALRKASLYIGQFAAMAVALVEISRAIYRLLAYLGGGSPVPAPGAPVLSALLALGFWAWLRWVTIRDGDFGREPSPAASWRRAYFYLISGAGLALASVGVAAALLDFLQVVAQPMTSLLARLGPSPDPITAAITALIVGLPLSFLSWRQIQRIAEEMPEDELNALSRKLLLHGWRLSGAVVTLIALVYILLFGLLILLFRPLEAQRMIESGNLLVLASCLPVACVAWLMASQTLREDAALGGENAVSASLRRFSAYVLAATGLTALWIGLTVTLPLIFQAPATAILMRGPGRTTATVQLPLAAVLVLIGAPVWWGHWRSQQARARRAGPGERAELVSTIRRIYLIGFVAAAVAALAFNTTMIINQSAAASLAGRIGASKPAAVAATLALIWLTAHALVLQSDIRRAASARLVEDDADSGLEEAGLVEDGGRAGSRQFQREELAAAGVFAATAAAQAALRAIVVVDGCDGIIGAQMLSALREALPGVACWPVSLSADAESAMTAALDLGTTPVLPPNLLDRVMLIAGPGDILVPGGMRGEVTPELAASIAASPARKLLLPPRDVQLRWVAAPQWPVEQWVENAVSEVVAGFEAEGT